MEISVRRYRGSDVPAMTKIWNQVVEDGEAFPQEEGLTPENGPDFFAAQSYSAVAEDEKGRVLGLYILHPNNVGRCGHICNASYAVERGCRGLHVGEKLVRDCLAQGKRSGFRILQFNAVAADNLSARHLYEKLGFQPLGCVPGGFRRKNGDYKDIFLYYHAL